MSLSTIKINNSSVIGVDNEPTASSDNLIKSDGVYKTSTYYGLEYSVIDNIESINNKYIDLYGQIQSWNGYYYTVPVQLTAGYTLLFSWNDRAMGNMSYLSKATSADDTGANGYTPIPNMNNVKSGDKGFICYYIEETGWYVFSWKMIGVDKPKMFFSYVPHELNNLNQSIQSEEKEIKEINDIILNRNYINLFNKNDGDVSVGYYLDYSDGYTLLPFESWNTTGFIEVDYFKKYDMVSFDTGSKTNIGNGSLYIYDKNKNYIGHPGDFGTSQSRTLYQLLNSKPLTSDVKYVRFCFGNNFWNYMVFGEKEKLDSLDKYAPYVEDKDRITELITKLNLEHDWDESFGLTHIPKMIFNDDTQELEVTVYPSVNNSNIVGWVYNQDVEHSVYKSEDSPGNNQIYIIGRYEMLVLDM